MNDETEFHYVSDLLVEVMSEELCGMVHGRDLFMLVLHYFSSMYADMEEQLYSYYVASFSRTSDNLTLWAEFD